MQTWRSCGYLLLDLRQSPPGSFREDEALSLGSDHGKAVLICEGDGYAHHLLYSIWTGVAYRNKVLSTRNAFAGRSCLMDMIPWTHASGAPSSSCKLFISW